MNQTQRTFLLFSFLLGCMCGCDRPAYRPGRGGLVHHPPAGAGRGSTLTLAVELSVWGETSRKIARRYTSIACHYHDSESTNYQKVGMSVVNVEEDRMFLKCEIKIEQNAKATNMVYYFDFLFDKTYNKSPEYAVHIINNTWEQET